MRRSTSNIGSVAIAISLALGLGARETVNFYLLNRCLKKKPLEEETPSATSSWDHL